MAGRASRVDPPVVPTQAAAKVRARGSAFPEEPEAVMITPPLNIPGTRESGMLTTFGVPAAGGPSVPDGPSTMDAVTTAERQREGGGAPSQRRPRRTRVRWTGARTRAHELLLALRVLFAWRVRTTHV